MTEHGTVARGRVYDAGTGRWYKDGYAPFQLPDYIRATCGRCGSDSLVIARGGAYCMACSPVMSEGELREAFGR